MHKLSFAKSVWCSNERSHIEHGNVIITIFANELLVGVHWDAAHLEAPASSWLKFPKPFQDVMARHSEESIAEFDQCGRAIPEAGSIRTVGRLSEEDRHCKSDGILSDLVKKWI